MEDDTDVLTTMGEILALNGYSVALARNGREAFERLAAQRPRVILLDLMMPVMDGKQFLELRRGDQALAEIPVVVLSAIADRAHDLGDVSEVLLKPVDINALLSTIDRFC
ncbi:MAG TPA: response regulator [Candidatus Binataceae bacterium]|nr:response regulator [Candidatus Binataceae bacterium]